MCYILCARVELSTVFYCAMEEASFRSRLDRTFGFLDDSNGIRGDSHLWSVEGRAASSGVARAEDNSDDDDDDEVSEYADFLKSEKRAKERSKSSFFGEDDLEELESGDEEEEEDGDEDEDEEEQMRLGKKKKAGGEPQTEVAEVNRASEGGNGSLDPSKEDDDEERQVREMVGMDCTLDFEDEEDEYDKVAAGTEGIDDRLFMSQVCNFGSSRQQLNPLPTSFVEMRQANRDRRADQKAALARLQEDDRLAAAKVSAQTVKSNFAEDQPARQNNGGEAMDIDGDHGHKEEPMEEFKNENLNPGSSLVSGVKKRKSSKRVRFSLDEDKSDAAASPVIASPFVEANPMPDVQSTANRYSKVPDYVKNPSKYLHYTLDWGEEDEEQANLAAFNATRVVSSSLVQDMVAEEAPKDPPGSAKISFNPHVTTSKRSGKESSSKGMGAEGGVSNGVVNVAANFDMDSSLEGPMTIDDEQGSIGQGKSGRVVRRYRNRVTDDVD